MDRGKRICLLQGTGSLQVVVHGTGSAMLAADDDHLESSCCSISSKGTCLAWVVSAFVRRQMHLSFPEERRLYVTRPRSRPSHSYILPSFFSPEYNAHALRVFASLAPSFHKSSSLTTFNVIFSPSFLNPVSLPRNSSNSFREILF
jgi:hypothetical protein